MIKRNIVGKREFVSSVAERFHRDLIASSRLSC